MSDSFANLCRLTGQAVNHFEMISEGDRILVGVSGGVDSMMLMQLLVRLQQRAPIRFELFAAVVDEGFSQIDHLPLKKYAAEQKWSFKVLETPIAELVREKGAEARPCSLCSRLRRGFLHGYADELNCNKIALGHHRDDLCVTFLMNLFRGAGLKTMAPNVSADAGSKRVIRPLCYAPKSLVELAAEGFYFPPMNRCDYAEQLKTTGDRAKAERLLIELESRFPGAGKQMLRSMSDLRPDHLLDPRFYNL